MSLCQVVNGLSTRASPVGTRPLGVPIVLAAQAGAATRNAILGVGVYGQ
jgi:hypothetical protein